MKALWTFCMCIALVSASYTAYADEEVPPPTTTPSIVLNAFSPNPTSSALLIGIGTVDVELGSGTTISNVQYWITNSLGDITIDMTDTTADDGAFDEESESFSFSFTLPAEGTYTVHVAATQTDSGSAEAIQEIAYATAAPTPTPSPTPSPTPIPIAESGSSSSSGGSDQGPGGDCCSHDDEKSTPKTAPAKGKVLGVSTKKPTDSSFACAVLPQLYPTFLNVFNLELNFPESDYWSYRVKTGSWKTVPTVLGGMIWHKLNKDTYDLRFNTKDDSINFRCVNKELIASIRWVFKVAYGRVPNDSEYGYWYRRLMRIEKISVPDLYGAMQWQKLHERDHSKDAEIVRNFKTLFPQ